MRYEGSTFLILRRMTMGTHDNPKLKTKGWNHTFREITEATRALLQQIVKKS